MDIGWALTVIVIDLLTTNVVKGGITDSNIASIR